MSDDNFLYELAGYVSRDPCICEHMQKDAPGKCISCRAREFLAPLYARAEAARRELPATPPTGGAPGKETLP